MKSSLSAAFSTKALQEQEHIVAKVVDSFISSIPTRNGSEGMNMTKWYEMVAFDILGEMAFGESFHSIESGQLAKTCGRQMAKGAYSSNQESHTSGQN